MCPIFRGLDHRSIIWIMKKDIEFIKKSKLRGFGLNNPINTVFITFLNFISTLADYSKINFFDTEISTLSEFKVGLYFHKKRTAKRGGESLLNYIFE